MLPIILSCLWVALAGAECYEPSQAYPLPQYNSNDALLEQAFAAVSKALTIEVAAPEFASTSFSVEVTSSKQSLWSQHHTAPKRNASRPDIPDVNGDALYRIASITKTFTVLGILYQHKAGSLSLDDPIDKYISQLKEEQKGTIPWKDITLRSLASQLSGIPRDCILPSHRICSLFSDFMTIIKSYAPIFAPNQMSTYSNIAFGLLGLAIENVTHQTYESYINNAIFKPLDMTKSSLSKPSDSAGVIPLEPHDWDLDIGVQRPTGGIYSSTNDLSKYLRYILTHYNGITHAINWLHPLSPSTGLNSFYGMPWEIFHTDRILEKSKRTVKFATKGGSLQGYTSVIITIPEYDLGVTILVAGNSTLLLKIQEAVTVTVVRAAEQVAIKQLQKRYAGTYASSSSKSSVTLMADHRGLVVTNLISDSAHSSATEMVDVFRAPPEDGSYVQLVPTLLHRNETAQSGELWRIVTPVKRTNAKRPVWADFCPTNVGGYEIGGLPTNEVVFWCGAGKAFDALEIVGYGAKLLRKKDDEVELVQEQGELWEL